MENYTEEEGTGRRSFLKTVNLLLGSALAAIVALPGIGYLLHPLQKKSNSPKTSESRLGPIENFKLGVPRKVSITATHKDAWLTTPDVAVGAVWVVRTQETPPEFNVLSTICPHMGCPVSHSKKNFVCPCHNSQFTTNGQRIDSDGKNNPSPRNMDALTHRIEDGVLICSYEKFRPGVEQKITIGS